MVTPHLSDKHGAAFTRAARKLGHAQTAPKLFGPAFTVRTSPGDNLLVHKAIDNRRGATSSSSTAGRRQPDNAIIGELMSAARRQRGVRRDGDLGAIRDSAELAPGQLFPSMRAA